VRLLGDHHDLHVLAGFAADRGGLEPKAMEALKDRIAARQKKASAARQDRVRPSVRRNGGRLRGAARRLSRRPVNKPMAKEDEPERQA